MTSRLLFLLFAFFSAGIVSAPAENLPAEHPSAAAVKHYLESVVKEDWKAAADMLLTRSLERLKDALEQSPGFEGVTG